MNWSELGRAIKRKRKADGTSLRDSAKAAKVDQATLYRASCGEKVNVENYEKIKAWLKGTAGTDGYSDDEG